MKSQLNSLNCESKSLTQRSIHQKRESMPITDMLNQYSSMQMYATEEKIEDTKERSHPPYLPSTTRNAGY